MQRYTHSLWCALLLVAVLLQGCGGSAAKPKWIDEDAASTRSIAVLPAGTQLVQTTAGLLYGRNSAGQMMGDIVLSRTGLQHRVVVNNQVLLYGVEGMDIWRIALDDQLQVQSDEWLASAVSSATQLSLAQWGEDVVLSWWVDGRFTYFREGGAGIQQLTTEQSQPLRTLAPGAHYAALDTRDPAQVTLLEVDLVSGATLGSSTLPAEFASVGAIWVNAGFVVGTQATSAHDGYDLLVWNRAQQTLHHIDSSGSFGHFELALLGQDGTGTLYYRYAAYLPHAGFSAGSHVRAISPTALQAWDFKLGSSSEFSPPVRTQMLPDGFRMLYEDVHETAVTEPTLKISKHYTTRYIQLQSNRQVVRRFYIQPYVVEITPFIQQGVIESGYRGGAFGADDAGLVYIDGTKVPLWGEETRYFAAQY